MKRFTTATLAWFDDGCCDVKYLDTWHDAVLNYSEGQANSADWVSDHYEQRIEHDADGRLFQTAANLLMRYRIYPDDVMAHYGDFDLRDRWLKVGDRIVQRIHIVRLLGRPVLDAITLTEITDVVNEPRRVGFTYATTASHAVQGKWTAQLTWQEEGDVVLTIDSLFRPAPGEPAHNHTFIRRLQKQAHKRGIAHFTQSVREQAAFPASS